LASDICRVFYFHYRERLYVCTSGYIKRADKTDVQEIQRALRIRNDFLQEYGV
jgi:phage-related protein